MTLLSAPVVAQSLFGSILGTITDNSQAVVTGAAVRIRSIDTNTIRTVKTDASGNFQAPVLPVGLYEVSCEHAGFKRSIVSGIKLEVDQRARVDIRLELGAVEQQVQITATASIIEADTASQGTVIDNQRIVELPLNGRNFEQLAVLAPGVIAPVAGAGNDAYFSVAGTRGLSNSFMMDGASNTNSNANVSFIRPSVDLIEEFKIQRNTFNAEYGRGAAQINVVTKSGTNNIRFTLFEFLRNNALNARNFFEQQQKRLFAATSSEAPLAALCCCPSSTMAGTKRSGFSILRVFDNARLLLVFQQSQRKRSSAATYLRLLQQASKTHSQGLYFPTNRSLLPALIQPAKYSNDTSHQ